MGLSLPTSPGLALPDEEGPSRVSRQQQQFLSFLPAQALIQPPKEKKQRVTALAREWMGQDSKGTPPPLSSTCTMMNWPLISKGPPGLSSWSWFQGSQRTTSWGQPQSFLPGDLPHSQGSIQGATGRLGDLNLSPITVRSPQHPYAFLSPFQAFAFQELPFFFLQILVNILLEYFKV